jgi:hypothetical protein
MFNESLAGGYARLFIKLIVTLTFSSFILLIAAVSFNAIKAGQKDKLSIDKQRVL